MRHDIDSIEPLPTFVLRPKALLTYMLVIVTIVGQYLTFKPLERFLHHQNSSSSNRSHGNISLQLRRTSASALLGRSPRLKNTLMLVLHKIHPNPAIPPWYIAPSGASGAAYVKLVAGHVMEAVGNGSRVAFDGLPYFFTDSASFVAAHDGCR